MRWESAHSKASLVAVLYMLCYRYFVPRVMKSVVPVLDFAPGRVYSEVFFNAHLAGNPHHGRVLHDADVTVTITEHILSVRRRQTPSCRRGLLTGLCPCVRVCVCSRMFHTGRSCGVALVCGTV